MGVLRQNKYRTKYLIIIKQINMKADNKKFISSSITTSSDFYDYLTALDLFRWSIKETPLAFEAIISMDTKPNLKNFTNVLLNEDKTYFVRLTKVDCTNKLIINY